MLDTAMRFLTFDEVFALVFALVFGVLITESLKRLHRHLCKDQALLYRVIGFLATAVCTLYLWPHGGHFPHPVWMAIFLGLAAPTVYKVVMAALRHFGLGWLADTLTGQAKTS